MHIGKQLLDDGFCFVIGALADMAVTDNALPVYQDDGRPSPARERNDKNFSFIGRWLFVFLKARWR